MSRNINFQLLDRVIEQIEKHPETWNQGTFRCETGMCVAGWAIEMSDEYDWAYPDEPEYGYVIRTGQDNGVPLEPWDAGRDLLGLTEEEADLLFNANNCLGYIKQIRRELQ